jgi:DNA-binding NarL/FixJ family response regulator
MDVFLPMKILVVDDHALIREALRGVLRELNENATVLEAAEYRHALRHMEQHGDVALILLDLNLPDRDGFAALGELRERYPAVAVVVLSGFQSRDNVLRALDLGAMGFIPKSAAHDVMVAALRLVLSGGVYVPPEALAAREAQAGRAVPGERVSPGDLGLTKRQVDVLALMMQGKSNKGICRLLDMAEPTVKNHVTAILKALQVENRTEAVIKAGQLGWDLQSANS